MEFRDYYAALGVPKTATAKEIKQAFRKLARKYHPDVNPGDAAAEARFKELSEANEVLSNPEARRKYDELGANWKAYEQAQRAGGGSPFGGPGRTDGPGGGAWSFGGQPGGRPLSPEEVEEMFGGGSSPFSDFFTTFFGGAGESQPRPGGRRHAPRHAARAQPAQHHELSISLEEAFTGTTRRVTLSTDGRVDRTIDVRFPAGIKDGQRVRAASDGGDVYFRVKIAPHARVERRGDHDLAVRVSVSLPTAVLGGEAEVAPLIGRPIRMRIPAGSAAGRTLRIRGQGMPIHGSPETRGDLLVSIDLQVPTTLSDEEREHYEALAALASRPAQPA